MQINRSAIQPQQTPITAPQNMQPGQSFVPGAPPVSSEGNHRPTPGNPFQQTMNNPKPVDAFALFRNQLAQGAIQPNLSQPKPPEGVGKRLQASA